MKSLIRHPYFLPLLATLGLVIVGGLAGYCHQQGFIKLPPCPIYAITHTHCPGCGTIRALTRLIAHGDFIGAWHYNPLMIISIPFLILLILFPRRFQHPLVPKIILVIILLYWGLRNIPYPPFTALAPHTITETK